MTFTSYCPDCPKKFPNNAEMMKHFEKAHTGPSARKAKRGKREKILMDGYEFDSLIERDRYMELKAMQQAGKISNLVAGKDKLRFELIERFYYKANDAEEQIRAMTFTPDFMYNEPGKETPIVEEIKSLGLKLSGAVYGPQREAFKMRLKLFKFFYNGKYEIRVLYL